MHDWLVRLAMHGWMDLIALCDSYMKLKTAPIDAIWLAIFNRELLPMHHFWLPAHLHPPLLYTLLTIAMHAVRIMGNSSIH